jgi:probable F420-dependent oxidoreductase
MRFGLYLAWRQLGGADTSTEMANLITVATRAEALGFLALGLPDHVAVPPQDTRWLGSRWYDPLVALASVASVTRRILLVTDVLVLPYQHPLKVAKAIATLDAVSGGRAVLGAGSGYLQEEFQALGVTFAGRGRRTDAALVAILSAWAASAKAASASGDETYFPFSGVISDPAPMAGRTPIWVAGNGPAVLRRAARFADAWHPIRLSPAALAVGSLQLRHQVSGRAVPAVIPMSHYVSFGARSQPGEHDDHLLTGSVSDIVDDLHAYRKAGVETMMLRFRASGPAELLEALEMFARDVAPTCA